MSLRRDCLSLTQQLQGAEGLTDLSCDDACINFKMCPCGQSKHLDIAIHYMDLDSYPRCSCLALCEASAKRFDRVVDHTVRDPRCHLTASHSQVTRLCDCTFGYHRARLLNDLLSNRKISQNELSHTSSRP